jgi:Short C-terminal domain
MTEAARQVSDDGLWEWDDKKWVHIRAVAVQCPECAAVTDVRSDAKTVKCSNGHEFDFIVCSTCAGATHRARAHRSYAARCPYCGASSMIPSMCRAWDWAVNQAGRGAWPPQPAGTADTERRVLSGFALRAAGGTTVPIGSSCIIDFGKESIRIEAAQNVEDVVLYRDVHALQVTGSTTRHSAGVFGGGFGVAGAAEGILAASVVNSLSATTTVYTVLRIATTSAEYVFVSNAFDNNALQMFLTPVQPRIRQAQANSALPVPSPQGGAALSVADELTKLAQLRDAGVLSDEEFAAAKTRLLGS